MKFVQSGRFPTKTDDKWIFVFEEEEMCPVNVVIDIEDEYREEEVNNQSDAVKLRVKIFCNHHHLHYPSSSKPG